MPLETAIWSSVQLAFNSVSGCFRHLRPHVWLGAELRGRQFFGPAETSGALGVRLLVRELPLDLRLSLDGRLAFGAVAGALSTALRTRLALSSGIGIAPSVIWVPTLAARLQTFSADAASVRPGDARDPWLVSPYGERHRFGLEVRSSLIARPFSNHVLSLAPSVLTNEVPSSVDRASLRLTWSMIDPFSHLAPELRLSYESSYRFSDDDRAEPYLRHRFAARVRGGLFAGRALRFQGFVSATHFLSPVGANEFLILGGVEGLFGNRGVEDLFVDRQDFESIIAGHRPSVR